MRERVYTELDHWVLNLSLSESLMGPCVSSEK